MNQKFVDLQVSLHGKEKAEKWLKDTPKITKDLKNKWSLEIGEEFELSYNYVISVEREYGSEAVLKVYFPDDPEYSNQLDTLKIFNGNGAVKILESDEENFAILMEKCTPGNTLSSLNSEEKETLIFCDIVKKLWQKPKEDYKFSNVANYLKGFDWYFRNLEKYKKSLDPELVKRARTKFKHLVDTQKDLYLLHSDLHHENILSSERGWLAIDPKGIIGEREYEVTAYMRNPIKRARKNIIDRNVLMQRLDIINRELKLDRQRLIDWSFSQTVLSIIWDLMTNGRSEEYEYNIAKELENLE